MIFILQLLSTISGDRAQGGKLCGAFSDREIGRRPSRECLFAILRQTGPPFSRLQIPQVLNPPTDHLDSYLWQIGCKASSAYIVMRYKLEICAASALAHGFCHLCGILPSSCPAFAFDLPCDPTRLLSL
jgi:hypothetical protein